VFDQRTARVQLQELLADVDVLDVRGDATVDVTTLEHDSRRVAPGACFACIVGSTTDGHHHAPSAVENGAVALLVERQLDLGVPEARVADVRRAFRDALARAGMSEDDVEVLFDDFHLVLNRN